MSQELQKQQNNNNDNSEDSEYYWTLERRRQLMKLPKVERQAILTKQAEEAAKYYEQDTETQDIGGGEIVDY